MITVSCPMNDSHPHEIFSSACECGCNVTFMENGNMVVTHQAFSPELVEKWGVFEEENKEWD